MLLDIGVLRGPGPTAALYKKSLKSTDYKEKLIKWWLKNYPSSKGRLVNRMKDLSFSSSVSFPRIRQALTRVPQPGPVGCTSLPGPSAEGLLISSSAERKELISEFGWNPNQFSVWRNREGHYDRDDPRVPKSLRCNPIRRIHIRLGWRNGSHFEVPVKLKEHVSIGCSLSKFFLDVDYRSNPLPRPLGKEILKGLDRTIKPSLIVLTSTEVDVWFSYPDRFVLLQLSRVSCWNLLDTYNRCVAQRYGFLNTEVLKAGYEVSIPMYLNVLSTMRAKEVFAMRVCESRSSVTRPRPKPKPKQQQVRRNPILSSKRRRW